MLYHKLLGEEDTQFSKGKSKEIIKYPHTKKHITKAHTSAPRDNITLHLYHGCNPFPSLHRHRHRHRLASPTQASKTNSPFALELNFVWKKTSTSSETPPDVLQRIISLSRIERLSLQERQQKMAMVLILSQSVVTSRIWRVWMYCMACMACMALEELEIQGEQHGRRKPRGVSLGRC